jgi:hypothetical protein
MNHSPASQLTTNSLKLLMGWDNYKTNADHETAASVMLTMTPSPLRQHETTLPRQYTTSPLLSPLTQNAQNMNNDEGEMDISMSNRHITNNKQCTDKISMTNLLLVGQSSGRIAYESTPPHNDHNQDGNSRYKPDISLMSTTAILSPIPLKLQ